LRIEWLSAVRRRERRKERKEEKRKYRGR